MKKLDTPQWYRFQVQAAKRGGDPKVGICSFRNNPTPTRNVLGG